MASIKSTLAVDGMTCASCVAHVTKALRGVAGVTQAEVNLATESAEITHGENVADAALVAAVVKAGYEARPLAEIAESDEDARRDNAVRRKRNLLVFAAVMFAPALLLGMFAPAFAGKDWILLALTVPVWAVVGWEFHRGAIAALRGGRATMDTLVSLGSTAAVAESIYAMATGRLTYFETAGAIVTLVFAGKYLETLSKARSNRSLRALAQLRPQSARRKRVDGSIETIDADRVGIGDVLSVAPGERIPVDGTVVEGASSIDRAMMTGEPIPVDVNVGSTVEQGTLNGDGALVIRADAVGSGTSLAHILAIVAHAQGTTPPVQRMADAVSAIFVPAILIVSALTLLGWKVTGHAWPDALVSAIAVLVVACPCALGLATPTAIVRAVGVGAKCGLLFRDAGALERLAATRVAIFDKTGTLTSGIPTVLDVSPASGESADDVLALAAAVERHSTHPLARAIVAAAEQRGAVAEASDASAAPGFGARARVNGSIVVVGSADFLANDGVAVTAATNDDTNVYVARDERWLGTIALGDTMRAQAPATVDALRSLGVEIALVSGDADGPTRVLAETLGITRWHARALPEQKAAFVASLQRDTGATAFVGDGINDAPALATAGVGIAMGGGSAAALETAGVALLSDDPLATATAIALARATRRVIAQNLFWACIYNAILIPLAAFGIVNPIFAAAAMGLSSLFVVGNSLRLNVRR